MKIAELFYSIQGEGCLAGVPSAFVRTSGCNLRCAWCDSDYTSWRSEGEKLTVAEVLDGIAMFPTRHVVVTGGEPLIAAGIEELCAGLRERGYHITVETAATAFKPVACDLISLSPKLANSTPHQREGGRWAERHDRLRLRYDVIRAFMERSDYQLKFVVDQPGDVDEVLAAALGPMRPAPLRATAHSRPRRSTASSSASKPSMQRDTRSSTGGWGPLRPGGRARPSEPGRRSACWHVPATIPRASWVLSERA